MRGGGGFRASPVIRPGKGAGPPRSLPRGVPVERCRCGPGDLTTVYPEAAEVEPSPHLPPRHSGSASRCVQPDGGDRPGSWAGACGRVRAGSCPIPGPHPPLRPLPGIKRAQKHPVATRFPRFTQTTATPARQVASRGRERICPVIRSYPFPHLRGRSQYHGMRLAALAAGWGQEVDVRSAGHRRSACPVQGALVADNMFTSPHCPGAAVPGWVKVDGGSPSNAHAHFLPVEATVTTH